MMSPVAMPKPMRSDEPLPRFTGLWWTRYPGRVSNGASACFVPSVEPSLMTMISLSNGSAGRRSSTSATVAASL